MFVTPEVSQLETSALTLCLSLKRFSMSVMAETPQSAIAPYVAVAEVGLALYALTAVFSSALLVKVRGQVPVAQFPLYSFVCFQTGKPTHAQRISSLFSADKECELCRVGKDGVCEARGEPHHSPGDAG